VFHPGDTVSVTVSIAAPLLANDVAVGVPRVDTFEGTNYNGSTYQVSFTIPGYIAGPLQLTPEITDTSNNPINGITTTIAVRPTAVPTSLTLPQSIFILRAVGKTARIYVVGNYADGSALDLSSSASGTTYVSSNPKVLTVDSEGNVTAVAFGTAAVTVANNGTKASRPSPSKTWPIRSLHRIPPHSLRSPGRASGWIATPAFLPRLSSCPMPWQCP
jgi:hypothetical protein